MLLLPRGQGCVAATILELHQIFPNRETVTCDRALEIAGLEAKIAASSVNDFRIGDLALMSFSLSAEVSRKPLS